MALLETPSRILRRMEALQAQDSDLPSLPSMPAFDDDSAIQSLPGSSVHSLSLDDLTNEEEYAPYHSTPAPMSSHSTRSTLHPRPSTSSSATRFANSMRMSMSTGRTSQEDREESFEVSEIIPGRSASDSSSASLPNISLPTRHGETPDQISMQEREELVRNSRRSVKHSLSPLSTIPDERQRYPSSRKYDYSISLRSEPKPSPIHSNRNVSLRKPLSARTRTPSLSRTTPSPTSSSSNSTPRSTYLSLPRDIASPVPPREELSEPEDHSDMGSEQGGDLHVLDDLSLHPEEGMGPDEEDQLPDRPQDDSSVPTFSEEHIQSSESGPARTPFPKAFSSPPSTITPAYVSHASRSPAEATPRPNPGVADDLTTPYNRRRSFLLSLVHSTTRPRMKFPTPHPHTRNARSTPRPHPHPLSQAWTPSPSLKPTSVLNSGYQSDSGSSNSPHDRLSFISTASSHDLTVHPRANASFDPVIGSKGVGRFNAVKLNTYLHGLNRRLQEENETLVARLRMHGEEIEMGKVAEELEREGFKGVEEAVLEEVDAMRNELEGCELERDALKMEKDALTNEVDTLKNDGDEIKAELEAEREERKKDKERWKERMAEVESGVEGVIKELERRLGEAEREAKGKANAEDSVRKLEERCNVIQEELDVANRRAEKAEDALANSSDLGPEVKQANERGAAYREKVRVVSERANELEHQLQDAEQREEQLRITSENQLAELDAELRHSLEAQQSAEAHALELEAELKAGEERVDSLEEQLTVAREKTATLMAENEDVQARLERLKEDSARATEATRQMEDALEESERKMIADEQELASLRARVIHLERELDAHRERTKASTVLAADLSRSRSRPAMLSDAEIEQLETELDNAHKEIARLNYVLSESPSRKAIERVKDMRIELLEREKDELSERVQTLKTLASSPSKLSSPGTNSPAPHRQILTLRTPKTPGGPLKDYSWLHGNTTAPSPTPFVSQIEHLQKELNKANDSIDEKVDRLEEAGMDIVGLTEKLEDARACIVTLKNEIDRLARREDRRMQRLERVRCLKCGGRIDLSNLPSKNDGNQSSLELSSTTLPSNPPTPPSKTTDALRSALQTVNSQLSTLRSQWESERKQLLGEKAVLQNAANRLNTELGVAKNEAKQALESGRQNVHEEAKARTNVEAELEKAKLVVDDLEDALRSERSRLRALSSEQNRMSREEEGILLQLQRAQSDMEDVKTQLEKVKRDNRELEAELRATATVDQKARLLEAKVSENQDTIEQLRNERQSLAADHADLQHQYVKASAHVTRLRQELAVSQTAHDEHRHQLDLRVNKIDELHRDLTQQARELERIESEKDQAWADRNGIVRTVASLESDLERVKHDAKALGKVLGELTAERDRLETKHRDELGKADRAHKQLYAQCRLANEQLEAQREKTKRAIADLEGHVCSSNEQDTEHLRIQHKNECKGLMVQIRYLKAKFTRESVFRADLGYQKHYLLGILDSFEQSERQALAMIAKIGFPLSQPKQPCKRRTLRTIAVAALFIAKARRASDVWREQSASKSAVTAALQDVRRRRVAGSLGYT